MQKSKNTKMSKRTKTKPDALLLKPSESKTYAAVDNILYKEII